MWLKKLFMFFAIAGISTFSLGLCDDKHLKFVPELSTSVYNETTTPIPDQKSGWKGYVGSVVAVTMFGSNFVPIKKFETGDGMFFQWILCVAIWIGGLVTNCIQNFPKFYPLAMLGGALWATGNICVVPIVKSIGLGLGMLIWGTFDLLAGWASGRFGWFGLTPETPTNIVFNDIAICFAMMSVMLWLGVRSDVSQRDSLARDEDIAPLQSGNESICDVEDLSDEEPSSEASFIDRLSATKKRILGCTLAIFSGILYGVSFTPVIHIKNNYKHASQTDTDYVFAHFCGIFATSTLYFVLYSICKRNKPVIYPSVVLPAMVSGGMWAVAEVGWFIANHYLSEAISFPIITTGPGIVASMWGVCVFREVKGRRNYIIMALAYSFTIAGAVMAGLSKA